MPIHKIITPILKILNLSDVQNFKEYRLNSLLESPNPFGLTYNEAIKGGDTWWQGF